MRQSALPTLILLQPHNERKFCSLSSGHQHQGVATSGYVFDDVFLRTTKLRVAEDVE